MSDLDVLMETVEKVDGDKSVLGNNEIAHLVASGHKLLSMKEVPGLHVDARETRTGIYAGVTVTEGVRIKNPVHLCFGILHKKGSQQIQMRVRCEKDSSAYFIAHCIFPNAEKVRHVMDAEVRIGENAEMRYRETHYHGTYGGIEVVPRSAVSIGRNGRYYADFNLTVGRVGKLDIDYAVGAGENSITELVTRVFGHDSDVIRIRDKVMLEGRNARSIIKTRVAVEDEALAEVTGITEGGAEGARGHVDCMEIVKDHALAKAVPIVNVTHPLAKVTHEAAIGSVDKGQLETLMAHGLTPEESVDIIVKGILL